MDAFIYSSKLVSYIIHYYYKFGIFFNPNFKEFLWPIYHLTRRTISQLMMSGQRVTTFLPYYHMPIITPIQYPIVRRRVQQLPSQMILRNITQEGNKDISNIGNGLLDHANIGIQDKGGQILGFSPESRPSNLPIREHNRINSTAQLRRHLGITSFDSVYQGLMQDYEPFSTRVTKALMEQIKSLHLVGGNPLSNMRHLLSQEVTIPRYSVPFSNFGLTGSSNHMLSSVGTAFTNVISGAKGARADAAAAYVSDLDVSVSSIADIPGVVPSAIPGAISFPELDSYPIIGEAIRGVKGARADAAAAYAGPASASHAPSVSANRRLSSRPILIPELVGEKTEMGKTISNSYDNLLHIFGIWNHVSQLLSYLPIVDQFFKMAYGVTDDYLGSGLYKANTISKSLPIVADAYSRYHKATGFRRINEENAGLRKGYSSEELDNWMKFGSGLVIPFDGIKHELTGRRKSFSLGSDDNFGESYDLESKDALNVLSNVEGFSDITRMDKNWARGEKIVSQEVEGVKVRIWENFVKNKPLFGLSPRAREVQEKLSLKLDRQKLVREMIPFRQIRQIHNKYSESISDLAGMMDSQPSLFKGKIPSVLAHNNQLSGVAREFESVMTSLRKSANSSPEKIVTGLENQIRKTERGMTQWRKTIGAGLSKQLLSAFPQPITALAVGSTKREGTLNAFSLNLIPPRGALGNLYFSDIHNFPYKPRQTTISPPLAQPSVSSLPVQENNNKSDSISTYDSNFDWDDHTDNTARAFELFADDFKGSPSGEVGDSIRISPLANEPVTPNRSVLQKYIKDSIQDEILKYYYNDLSYPPQPHIEERERKLYHEVCFELERNLKDELRRYGYVN